MDIYTNKQMDGMTPENQAKKAMAHILQQVRDNPKFWDVMGLGTQSYALLTEAAATMFGEPVETVRKKFVCRNCNEKSADEKLSEIRLEVEGYVDGAPDASPSAKLANKVMQIIQS